MLDGLEVAVDGAREEVLAGRARLDGALEAAKVGLELARDGAPPDMAAERDGRLEDTEVAMDGLLVALEVSQAVGAPVVLVDGRAGKRYLPGFVTMTCVQIT